MIPPRFLSRVILYKVKLLLPTATSYKMASVEKENALTGIISAGSRLEADDHEVNLHVLQSNDIALGDVGASFTEEQKFFILRRMNMDGLLSLDHLPPSATFMVEKMESLTEEESVEILKEYLTSFADDCNVSTADYNLNQRLVALAPAHLGAGKGIKEKLQNQIDGKSDAVDTQVEVGSADTDDPDLTADIQHEYHKVVDWPLQVKVEAGLIAYHSPYPSVRSVTEPYDDPTVPCETFRVYVVGIIWTAIGSVINQFFSERQPAILFQPSVAQVFIYPTGVLLSYILPKKSFKIWRYNINLNPGTWTYKEQMLATLCYSISGTTPYVSWNILVQKSEVFYDNKWVDFGYQVLLMLSSQFLGFGLAGIMRRFVVYPVQSIWPTVLPTIALNKALTLPEQKENIHGWTISRYYFFFATFFGSFLYFWIPNYLMQFLSTFNWMTWIKPSNLTLANITGSVSGLGLNPISTFDWTVLNYNLPLTIPFYSTMNQAIGWTIAFFCIIGVYYSNNLWSQYIPINTNGLYTNTGQPYAVTAVLNEKGLFDEKKYQEVGPPFYSAANLVVYGAFFAIYPFAFVYEFVVNWRINFFAFKSIWQTMRNFRRSNYEGFNDPYSRSMAKYKEVPDWVFFAVLIISIVLSILCVKLYPAETPVWGIFFAIGINFVFLIPLASIYSRTGFSFGLNVLVELIVGYALPGNGLALMFIKAIGYNIDGQAENYISNQKMAHYVRIPPWSIFRVQMLSVFINCFITLGIISFQLTGITDYCDPLNKQKFTCAQARTFYSASVLWGVIGPKRVFNGLYPILQYCFLIGFLLTIPAVLFKWYGPKKLTKYFQPTVIIGGMLLYAPYNLTYVLGGLYLAIASMWYLQSRKPAWWQKYNYLFSAGMTAGVAFSGIIIFFAVQYHDKSINWWGNTVMYAGMDGSSVADLNATISAPDGYFGPRKGHYP
ncbi:hypothetical protein PGUG_03615 [Meyerozyma guilliermondii ATCC 6260]|uniref:OPT family small oligopeptide transporter n=1 Tax=Meyerozyma guilliermondii (strain ATCC 6260 / CBS 566 / DSM 6381 / JCM 1539 / NBRC 10279 / NRRL Y-324) TaxID=294746 RepID=A5DK14_PICGU|nr:uncharacterized protein PGUG_03615 [Meyerozyma guilliermondii ATCC 6260]EDK39517.2 hypothetical protein PGUG_03615 [Meyerozyma guilliermondii ATCC 6260]